MGSEKLGTCDERVRHTWDEVTGEVPHRLSGMCRNWREQPQGGATPAQTEGGEKPPRKVRRTIAEMKANGITAEDLEGVSTPANTALQLEPSSPPATAGTAREFVVEWAKQHKETYLQVDDIAACAEAYADQRVRRSEQFVAQLESNIKVLNERVEKLRQEQDALKKVLTMAGSHLGNPSWIREVL